MKKKTRERDIPSSREENGLQNWFSTNRLCCQTLVMQLSKGTATSLQASCSEYKGVDIIVK